MSRTRIGRAHGKDNRIGPEIRRLRHGQCMTLDDLAARADISASHLSRIETSRALPSFTVLDGIARALDVSIDELARLNERIYAQDVAFRNTLGKAGYGQEAIDGILAMPLKARNQIAEQHGIPTIPVA